MPNHEQVKLQTPQPHPSPPAPPKDLNKCYYWRVGNHAELRHEAPNSKDLILANSSLSLSALLAKGRGRPSSPLVQAASGPIHSLSLFLACLLAAGQGPVSLSLPLSLSLTHTHTTYLSCGGSEAESDPPGGVKRVEVWVWGVEVTSRGVPY